MEAKRANTKDLLTRSQLTVLVAIRDHVRKHRISPAHSEVAERLGVSRRNVSQSIVILQRKGVVHCTSGRFRNLVITRSGHAEIGKAVKSPTSK